MTIYVLKYQLYESYDSANDSLIPYTPHINYHNSIDIGKYISNFNEIDFSIIKEKIRK